MTATSRFLLRLARWIAGSERAEWIDAMQAEAVSIRGDSTRWAIGCVWAAFSDRFVRERRFLGAALLVVVGPMLLEMLLLYPEGWAWRQPWLHQHPVAEWLFQHSGLLNFLPFVFLLGRSRPGRGAYVAAIICFPLAEFVPLFIFWLKFGGSFLAWFGPGATWYMFSPAVGLSAALAVCLFGVWLGSRSRRRIAHN
jgi:hypothetical protein